MSKIPDVVEIIECPTCKSYKHHITKLCDAHLAHTENGYISYDCHCDNCGKDFHICIEFNYEITGKSFKVSK
jgi:hypothetical protein